MHVDHKVKVKNKRKAVQIPGPCQTAKEAVEHQIDSDSNRRLGPWNSPPKHRIETQ